MNFNKQSFENVGVGHTPDVFAWVADELQRLDQLGLRRQRRLRSSRQGPYLVLDGRRLLNFGSNDYLGLAARLWPDGAVPREGWGSGASPVVSGYGEAHRELEQALADWEEAEAALVFSSGYAANVGTISALVGRQDVVFSDALNHASIIDGCRLSRAHTVVYPHRDIAFLRQSLERSAGFRRRLIVTDTVFSMEGDVAPLEELVEVADRFEAMLLVDEAHATGVFGSQGTGVVGDRQLQHRVWVRVGTLSKALGCIGGFVVGPVSVIDWLTHKARSYFFSTAIPDPCAHVARLAVDQARQAHQAREHLWKIAAHLRAALKEQGWDLGQSSSHIVPVIVSDAQAAVHASQWLTGKGIFVPAIRPPSVPQGRSLLRISLSAAHSFEDVGHLIGAMAELRSHV